LKLVAQALEGFKDGVNDRLDAVAGNTVLAIRPELSGIVKRIDERSERAQKDRDALNEKADAAAKVLELVAGNIDKLPEQFKSAIATEIVPLVSAISTMDKSIDKQHLERKQQLSELQEKLYHFFEKFSAPIAQESMPAAEPAPTGGAA
jgi:chromosome condensin MukBEF MukE localization factor